MRKFIKKNKKIFLIISLVVTALFVRFIFFDFISKDYKIFLNKWLVYLNENNGFFGIKTLKSDYNLPYLFFLSLINYIPIKNLYLVKLLSCIFDLLLAKLGYDFIYYFTKNEKYSIIGLALILFSPTIILNSSAWGQCDSIYSFFALSSLFYLIKKEYHKSFIFLGIAFSLKLQTAFIFPIYVILYLKEKRFSFKYFFYVPLVNFIMCLPGHLIGISPFYTYKTYFFQTGEYLSTTAINIVRLLPYYIKYVNYFVLFFTGMLFLLLAIKCCRKKEKYSDKEILTIALIYIIGCYYFLPFMHERYMYMADVLCIIWYMIYRKNLIVPIAVYFCSLLGYLLYFALIIKVDLYYFFNKFALIGIVILLVAIYKLYLILRD